MTGPPSLGMSGCLECGQHRSLSDGLQPNWNGLQPNFGGLQPNSNRSLSFRSFLLPFLFRWWMRCLDRSKGLSQWSPLERRALGLRNDELSYDESFVVNILCFLSLSFLPSFLSFFPSFFLSLLFYPLLFYCLLFFFSFLSFPLLFLMSSIFCRGLAFQAVLDKVGVQRINAKTDLFGFFFVCTGPGFSCGPPFPGALLQAQLLRKLVTATVL